MNGGGLVAGRNAGPPLQVPKRLPGKPDVTSPTRHSCTIIIQTTQKQIGWHDGQANRLGKATKRGQLALGDEPATLLGGDNDIPGHATQARELSSRH